ncbi:tyrosine-type recombinase/integrase [Actinoplanes sp. NPDC049265]|uniref:tyrosine-type recombinase/integrase n=1 Tax=Actinoplanes sp. NPDC049265 TaxID=3363902 RepID=UPI00371D9637
MTRTPSHATDQIAMVRALLDQLGIRPEQLLTAAGSPIREIPTFDEYVPQVTAAISAGSRRVYQPYFRKICRRWGARRITEATASDIKRLAEDIRDEAIIRRNTRGGRIAAEHLISAMRCIYRHAELDGLIDEAGNPAARVAKPRRLANARHALSEQQLAAVVHVATTTGNDRDLDGLLIRLHLETACRRAGALGLRPRDLDPDQCLISLREKGGTARWQPVSPTLMRYLQDHHASRGDNDQHGPLLLYRNGNRLTRRRYDSLWRRLGLHLPWVATQQVTTHWLRYTTLTWVERTFSYAVARAFAGHSGQRDIGTTITYVHAQLDEVAAAVAVLTGEPHPLAGSRTTAASHSLPVLFAA